MPNRLRDAEPTCRFDAILEVLAGHQLHDDVGPTRLLVGGEDEDAARVLDRRRQSALSPEALDGVG